MTAKTPGIGGSPTSDAPAPATKKQYIRNGQILSSPPLTVTLTGYLESIRVFLGLYLVSLLALDPHAAAADSQFNVRSRRAAANGHTTAFSPSAPSYTTGPIGGTGGDQRAGGSSRGGQAMGSGRRYGTLGTLNNSDETAGSYCTSGSCG